MYFICCLFPFTCVDDDDDQRRPWLLTTRAEFKILFTKQTIVCLRQLLTPFGCFSLKYMDRLQTRYALFEWYSTRHDNIIYFFLSFFTKATEKYAHFWFIHMHAESRVIRWVATWNIHNEQQARTYRITTAKKKEIRSVSIANIPLVYVRVFGEKGSTH